MWECEDCETRFADDSLKDFLTASGDSFDLLGINSPSVIAVPILAYHREKHPVMRLHRLCDAIEMLTRFATVVMMSPFRQENGEVQFPTGLENFLRSTIRRPTLGVWARMLEALVQETRKEPLSPLIEKFVAFADSQLLPALLGTKNDLSSVNSLPAEQFEDGEILKSFIELRNVLVHGGAITNHVAAKYSEIWEARLEEFWQFSRFLMETELVYVQTPVCLKLYGNAQALIYEPVDELKPRLAALTNRVVLIERQSIVDLFPLCGYEAQAQIELLNQKTPHSPTLYYRAESEMLLYSVLGGDHPIAQTSNAMVDFVRMFSLDKDAASAKSVSRDFETDAVADAAMLVGRKAETEKAKTVIKKHSRGVLWIHGAGGIGKSFLAAKLAVDLKGDPRKALRVFWRFQAGDPRAAVEAFLEHSVRQLASWLRQPARIRDLQNRSDLENRLRELLGYVSQEETAATSRSRKRVLFVLDGIDEIARLDGEFTKIPFEMDFPNVVWVCVGREEGKLAAIFSPRNCAHVFEQGVPPLSSEDIRAMLLEQPGEMKYGLLKRDIEQITADSEKTGNPFIESVVANAKGLPLYVRFVIDDLLRGVYDFTDEKRLPSGLAEYYQRILSRLSIGDLQSILTPTMMLLALAGSPLDRECVYDLMAGMRRILPGSDGRILLDKAFEHAQTLLRKDPTAWETEGFRLCHDTLREYLLLNQETHQQRILMRDDLVRLIVNWRQLADGRGLEYLFRFGATHLAQAGQWSNLLSLLEAPEFNESHARFFRQELSADPDVPDLVSPLLDEAISAGQDTIVEILLPELQWAVYRGHYTNVEHYLKKLKLLCELSPEYHASHLVLIDYIRAWLEREKGNLRQAIDLFSQINLEKAGQYREHILFQRANATRESGDYQKAKPIYRQLYLETKKSKSGDFLIFAQQYADIEYVQGQNLSALNILQEIETNSAEEYPLEIAEVLRIEGHINRMAEKVDEAARLYRQSEKLFRETHSVFGIARVETNLAETFALVKPKKAFEHAQKAVRLNTNLGTLLEVGKARNALGLAFLAVGMFDESEKELKIALEIQKQVGYRSGQGMVWLNLMTHRYFTSQSPDLVRRDFFELYELFKELNAYPLLIYKGALLCCEWDVADEQIREIRASYAAQVQWLDSLSEFENLVSKYYRRDIQRR